MILVPSALDKLVIAEEFDGISPDELFRFWVQPDLLCKWWPAEAVTESLVGGSYRLSWPKIGMTLFGEILAFEPGKHFAFSWSWLETTEYERLRVDVFFEAVDLGTRIGVFHGPYLTPNVAPEDRQEHIDGWTHFLGKLKDLVGG